MVSRRCLIKCKSGLGLFDNSTILRSVKSILRSVKSQGIFWALVSGNPALGGHQVNKPRILSWPFPKKIQNSENILKETQVVDTM